MTKAERDAIRAAHAGTCVGCECRSVSLLDALDEMDAALKASREDFLALQHMNDAQFDLIEELNAALKAERDLSGLQAAELEKFYKALREEEELGDALAAHLHTIHTRGHEAEYVCGATCGIGKLIDRHAGMRRGKA